MWIRLSSGRVARHAARNARVARSLPVARCARTPCMVHHAPIKSLKVMEKNLFTFAKLAR